MKWLEAGEKQFAGPEIVQETADKVKVIRERLKAAQDRKKSYADKKRRPVEFQVGDRISYGLENGRNLAHVSSDRSLFWRGLASKLIG